MDVTSYLLGKKAGGGSTPVLQNKEISITTNGETTVTADSGYDGLSSVDINVNVPTGITPTGTINITQNSNDVNVTDYASANVSVKYAPRNISFSGYTGNELNYEISNLDTSNITNMYQMFYDCSNLPSLDLSGFNTSNVTNMNGMFNSCTSLTSLNLSGWNTSNTTNYQSMFFNCTSLTSLDLSSFTIKNNKTGLASMFVSCTSLNHIDIRKMELSKITSSSYYGAMFGVAANSGVPDNCEIIVKNDTEKSWVTSKFSRLTNVKTVAEYEG